MFGIESIVDEIKSKCPKFLSNKEAWEAFFCESSQNFEEIMSIIAIFYIAITYSIISQKY